jgi:hypothetical protein
MVYRFASSCMNSMRKKCCIFGNVDLIFPRDMYQTQPIRDSMIFEEQVIKEKKIHTHFWQDEVKCYELQTTICQKDIDIIRNLNKMRLNEQ